MPVYEKEIELNDVEGRLRTRITRPDFVGSIEGGTGATLSVRGVYKRPGAADPMPEERPLFLHISAEAPGPVDLAVAEIEGLLAQQIQQAALPPIDESDPVVVERVMTNGGGAETRSIGMLVGMRGLNLKYIERQTGCRAQVQGQGTQRRATRGDEAAEALPMHIAITGLKSRVGAAVALAQDLITTVLVQERIIAAPAGFEAPAHWAMQAPQQPQRPPQQPQLTPEQRAQWDAFVFLAYLSLTPSVGRIVLYSDPYSRYYAQQAQLQAQAQAAPPPPPANNGMMAEEDDIAAKAAAWAARNL